MGKLYQLPRGWWYVHCRWCEKEASFQVRNLEEAYGMLEKWRLDSDERQAHWSCPACCEYWDGRERATTDTAGTAATNTTTTSFDARELEVVALKAEVGELKAEIERLKAEVVELKYEDMKQSTNARPGHTIVVAFTEDEAKEMRDIAEETGRCGQSLVHLSVDICGPCNPWSPTSIADDMERDGNRIVTLSSRLLQLWNHKGLLELLSSRGV